MTLEDTLDQSEFTRKLFALFPEGADLKSMHSDVTEFAIWWSIILQEHDATPGEDKAAREELERLSSSLEHALELFGRMSEKARWLMYRRARILLGSRESISDARAKVDETVASLKSLHDLALVSQKNIPPARRGRPRSHADDMVKGLAEIWEDYSGRPARLSTDVSTGRKSSRFKDFCVLVVPMIFENAGLQPPSIDSAIKAAIYPPKKIGSP